MRPRKDSLPVRKTVGRSRKEAAGQRGSAPAIECRAVGGLRIGRLTHATMCVRLVTRSAGRFRALSTTSCGIPSHQQRRSQRPPGFASGGCVFGESGGVESACGGGAPDQDVGWVTGSCPGSRYTVIWWRTPSGVNRREASPPSSERVKPRMRLVPSPGLGSRGAGGPPVSNQ